MDITNAIRGDDHPNNAPWQINNFSAVDGEILQKVAVKIRPSILGDPRRIAIVFFNDQEFRLIAEGERCLNIVNRGLVARFAGYPIMCSICVACANG